MNLRKLQSRLFKAFIFFLPFQIGAFYTHLLETDLIFLFDLILWTLYLLWIYRRVTASEPEPILWGKAAFPSLLIIVWSIVSFTNAISLTMTGYGVYMTVKAFLIYLYFVNHIQTKRDLQVVVTWLLGGLLFQGFLGLVQFTTGSSLGLEFAGAVVRKKSESGLTRIRGTLSFPNQFGAWLALHIPVATSLFIFELRSRKKLFYGLAAGFGSVALLLSFSRSAWAGILGGLGILFLVLVFKRLLKPKYLLTLAVAMLVAAGLVIFFWDLITRRFETGATGKYRLIMVNIALEMFKDNYLFGVGLHNYRFHSMEYFRFWKPVHNTYLRLLAETGLPGLLFFLMLIWTAVRESFIMIRTRDRFIFSVALGVFCSLTAFLFTINFGPEYEHYRVKVMFWVVIGLVFCLRRVHAHTLRMRKLKGEQTGKGLKGTGEVASLPEISPIAGSGGWKR